MKTKLSFLPINLFANLLYLIGLFMILYQEIKLSLFTSIIVSFILYLEISINQSYHDYLESKINEINNKK